MKSNLFFSGLFSLAGLFSFSAQAVELTEVVNDHATVAGWTVSSIAGGGGPGSSYVVYRVQNTSNTVYVVKTTNGTPPASSCTVSTSTAGYHTSGGCSDYYLFKND